MHTSILDTHLHLYPEYDLPQAFNQLIDHSAQFGQSVSRIACLAERHDCQYFNSISQGDIQLDGFKIEPSEENEILLKRERDQLCVSILPGRQVITAENIEILALASNEAIDDGQPALDVIYQVNQLGGVPVLAWSPGKWFAKRGKLVKRLITELDDQSFLIGDTTLRPYGWQTPGLMKQAMANGFGVVAGSDPLPFAGEEKWLGQYYSVVETQTSMGATELLHTMKNDAQQLKWQNTGKRTNVFSLFERLRKNAASKK
jgi:hypothetical protein